MLRDRSLKDGQRVWNEPDHCLQRTSGPAGAARQIYDERTTPGPCNRTAQWGKFGLLPALRPHQFRKSIENAVADCASRLRRHIPGSHPGATRSDYQSSYVALLPEDILNFVLLVRDYQVANYVKAMGPKYIHHQLAGNIDTFALKTRVTDRDHDRTQHGLTIVRATRL